MDSNEARRLTEGYAYTSEKIRILFKKGVKQAAIARFLGTSDQYVSNVVRAMKGRQANQSDASDVQVESYRLRVGPDGRIVIPAAFRKRFGLHEGKEVVLRAEEDSLKIEDVAARVARARKLMKKYGVRGGGMADELIEDRRKEAARETES